MRVKLIRKFSFPSKNNKDRGRQLKILARVWEYLKEYRLMIIASLVLSILSVAGALYAPILVGKAIDIVVPGPLRLDKVMKYLSRTVVVVLATAALQYLMGILNNRITYGVLRDLRNDVFSKFHKLPLSYLDKHPSGDLVSRIMTDADQVADGLLMGFSQLFTGLVTIIATLVIMLRLSWLITIVVVVITPLSLFVASYIATHTYDMFLKQSKIRGTQTALIDEALTGIKVIKAFGTEEDFKQRFEKINDELTEVSMKAIFFSSLTNPCTRFVNSIVYAAVVLAGGFAVLSQGITVGLLTVFLSYSSQYTKPFNEISGVITELQNAIACAGRIFELLDAKDQIPDGLDAEELMDTQGRVDVSDVSFSYDPEKKLIENFNISVEPGQNVAICGPTGCGKTTIINLLMRFYDVGSGSICVDGRNIRNITRESLRSSYGMVLQDTWLRSGSIRDNIKFSRPDATDEEMIEAAKAAYSDHFIRRLPDGYDTIIGEDGGILSAGQKQLLCITRVMLALPPMLILDEATSSIDTRTEMKIQSAFIRMMEGRTTFIVAHRLSTIRNADLILVMKDGNIVEQGDHESLLAKGGFYTSLYNS